MPAAPAESLAAEPHSITVLQEAPPFEVVGVIDDGVRALHPESTRDGSIVYVSDRDGGIVRACDAAALELITEIDGIDNPTGILNASRRLETLGHTPRPPSRPPDPRPC